eukprot:SAG22_NODE_1689_length_3806_cov_7.093067_4_plen_189_part_00
MAAEAAGVEFALACRPVDAWCCRRVAGADTVAAAELVIERDLLLSVLRREDTFRFCGPVQALYDQYAMPPPVIEAELQRRALAEHGLCRCYLLSYWQTARRWPTGSDAEINQATVWLRVFDRTRAGTVAVGAKVPPVPLVALDSGRPTTLLLASGGCGLQEEGMAQRLAPPLTSGGRRPLVAVAGSGS